ncbi:MAG TPA: hypothetical protein VMC84_08645 [Methanocella sp.]|uniref:hypothetical protein n=1 Tax=Methanocella sp. TaxID=2052833 RepID=UPI002B953598|nr:hypothetical protein [Methanocella sp.]HTY91229.1 hypothetical protein [Methanocella sp.]
MRFRTIVLALLLIPLLAVSAGAAYIEGQAPPAAGDGTMQIMADDGGVVSSGAVSDPVLYTAMSDGAVADGNLVMTPTCGNFVVPSWCSNYCPPCYSCPSCNYCPPCITYPSCNIQPQLCSIIHSPTIEKSVPSYVINNWCNLVCPCFSTPIV